MQGERTLVTGGTGFIGGRLVEKLVLERGTRVRVLLRDLSRAARVARFDLEMAKGDVGDAGVLSAAVRDCDLVFHCAHDSSDHERNVAAASTLVSACGDAGVRRLVYVSSAAVYEPLSDGVVAETPVAPNGWSSYRDSKIRVEQTLLRAAAEARLSVVIVQPTIVYGPFGTFWTAAPIHWLRRGRIVLPGDRDGLCNAVYVDDVVDAMLLSAEAERAVGERILVSAEHPVPWRQYFATFERALGVSAVVHMPHERLRALAALTRIPRIAAGAGTVLAREPLTAAWTAPLEAIQALPIPIPPLLERRMRSLSSPWRTWFPDEHQLALFSASATVSIDKARRLLGFQPRFDFERGMHLTRAYIAWANL